MPYSIPSTTVQGINTDSAGNYLTATVATAGAVLPTTANTFAAGCKVINTSDGTNWFNSGTAAAPVWTGTGSKTVALAAADLIAMYTTPVQVVAPVAGFNIIVDSVDFDITRTSTAFTGGGVVAVQYANTANGAGTATHATIAATVVTGAAGRTVTARIPVVQSDIATASITGIGLFISNATAAFAAGTGTASVVVKYHLL
jgi:hypothetical protein